MKELCNTELSYNDLTVEDTALVMILKMLFEVYFIIAQYFML